jgi:hypothetical protein
MELVLLGITVVSLIAALVMSATAWRVNRDERIRSDARVAALNAAAGEGEKSPRPQPQPQPQAQPVIEAPPAQEPVAVNESRQSSPPWATARVSTFAIPGRAAPAGDAVIAQSALDSFPAEKMTMGESFLGTATAAPESAGRQRTLAMAAVVLFLVFLVGGYRIVFGGRTQVTAVAAAPATTAPLELLSLRHERRGGRLAVTGLVRNPANGAPMEKLNAVVFLFDQGGNFLSSARTDIDYVKLTPGDESPFVITVDAPATVARYRVSFRNDTGVVPHIDRRGQDPVASTAIGREPAAVR